VNVALTAENPAEAGSGSSMNCASVMRPLRLSALRAWCSRRRVIQDGRSWRRGPHLASSEWRPPRWGRRVRSVVQVQFGTKFLPL